jgi:hypothetical protein
LKIRADEHVATSIVSAVREIALRDEWKISSVYDSGDRGAEDEHWITKFSKEGGNAILSADRGILSQPPQVIAVFDTGMKVIHLPPKWANSRGVLQAAHILLWWSRIEATIEEMRPRECYRPPWNLSESGKLKRIPIDYAAARKKIKKASRRPS